MDLAKCHLEWNEKCSPMFGKFFSYVCRMCIWVRGFKHVRACLQSGLCIIHIDFFFESTFVIVLFFQMLACVFSCSHIMFLSDDMKSKQCFAR